MISFKHYSFDLWLTLIKSNPTFKLERAKFFYKNFNSCNKTIEEVISVFRKVDTMCNAINEKTGKNIDGDEMYLMVISLLNGVDTSFNNIDMEMLYNEMDSLLFNYMPVVYCMDTINILNRIKEKDDCTFNISSNTAFIKGKSLRKVLTNLQLSPFFEFQIYSDEIGLSKPDKQFFEKMLQGVHNIYPEKNIALNQIVHIGDNPVADIEGAATVGIKSRLINSNNLTISSLLN